MSEYHEKHRKIKQKIEKPEKAFWERIFSQDVLVSLVSLAKAAKAAKEGLLALAVQVGLEVFRKLLEIEVTMKVGEKGKHNPNRQAYRHGYETGEIILGARKVKVQRPRARTLDGREVELEVYKAFQEEDMLSRAILERMIHGLSCRCYSSGLEDIGSTVEAVGISKSTLSRRFVEMTRKALGELLSRPLNDLDLLVLFIDGVVISDHTVVEALGIDSEGCKHILGLWEGATEGQILRWTAAGLLDAEKRFRRIQGYQQLPLLKAALEREAYHQERKEMVSD